MKIQEEQNWKAREISQKFKQKIRWYRAELEAEKRVAEQSIQPKREAQGREKDAGISKKEETPA